MSTDLSDPAAPSVGASGAPASPITSRSAPSGLVVSRRALLQRGGLLVGGLGAATLASACAAPKAPGWTFGPALAVGSPSPATEPSASSASPTASPAGSPVSSPSPGPATARDPSPADFAVPPPYRPHTTTPVEFKLTAHDGPGQTILIDKDRTYGSMNFEGQVPAPTLRVTEGDVVRFTLTNAGSMQHSIDFHAAQTPWSKNYQAVDPGTSFSFDWTARYPGVFMYHCGTPPVLMHIGDGMYGAVIVDPKDGRPTAREFVVVQSEFYGAGGDYKAMLNNPVGVGNPDSCSDNPGTIGRCCPSSTSSSAPSSVSSSALTAWSSRRI